MEKLRKYFFNFFLLFWPLEQKNENEYMKNMEKIFFDRFYILVSEISLKKMTFNMLFFIEN